MGILKSQRQTQNPRAKPEAEALLKKAVVLDPRCAEAWLQLGILSYERHDLSEAMDDYRKAIEANPGLGEAHYRLGVAYDRTGESAKAKQEFELHSQIEKAQAEAVEQRRKEIRQFVIVPSTQATAAPK
jgi:tetratricopeptide (TPR) repeat protein